MTASLGPALLAHGPIGSQNLLDRFSHISPEQWELAEPLLVGLTARSRADAAAALAARRATLVS